MTRTHSQTKRNAFKTQKPPTHKNRLGASSKNTNSLSFHLPAVKRPQISTAPGRCPTPALIQMSTFIWATSIISNRYISRRHSQSQMRLQMRRLMPEGGRGSLSYPRQRPSWRSHDSDSHGDKISPDGSARHTPQFTETTTQKLVGIFSLSQLLSLSIPPRLLLHHSLALCCAPFPPSFPAPEEPIRRVMTSPLSSQWALRFEDASCMSMGLISSGAQAKLISITSVHDHLSLNTFTVKHAQGNWGWIKCINTHENEGHTPTAETWSLIAYESVCVCVGNRHCDPDCTDTLWMLTPLAELKGLCVPDYVCSIISIVA